MLKAPAGSTSPSKGYIVPQVTDVDRDALSSHQSKGCQVAAAVRDIAAPKTRYKCIRLNWNGKGNGGQSIVKRPVFAVSDIAGPKTGVVTDGEGTNPTLTGDQSSVVKGPVFAVSDIAAPKTGVVTDGEGTKPTLTGYHAADINAKPKTRYKCIRRNCNGKGNRGQSSVVKHPVFIDLHPDSDSEGEFDARTSPIDPDSGVKPDHGKRPILADPRSYVKRDDGKITQVVTPTLRENLMSGSAQFLTTLREHLRS